MLTARRLGETATNHIGHPTVFLRGLCETFAHFAFFFSSRLPQSSEIPWIDGAFNFTKLMLKLSLTFWPDLLRLRSEPNAPHPPQSARNLRLARRPRRLQPPRPRAIPRGSSTRAHSPTAPGHTRGLRPIAGIPGTYLTGYPNNEFYDWDLYFENIYLS